MSARRRTTADLGRHRIAGRLGRLPSDFLELWRELPDWAKYWSRFSAATAALIWILAAIRIFDGTLGAGMVGGMAATVGATCGFIYCGHQLRGGVTALIYTPACVFASTVSILGASTAAGKPGVAAGLVALFPATVGAWWVVLWVGRLSRAGSREADLLEATNAVRPIAVIWDALLVAALISAACDQAGFHWDVADAFDSGYAALLGAAAVVAYVGPGYSQYRRGLLTAEERDSVAAIDTPGIAEPLPSDGGGRPNNSA